MTGCFAIRSGTESVSVGIPLYELIPWEETIPERLKSVGYATAILGKTPSTHQNLNTRPLPKLLASFKIPEKSGMRESLTIHGFNTLALAYLPTSKRARPCSQTFPRAGRILLCRRH